MDAAIEAGIDVIVLARISGGFYAALFLVTGISHDMRCRKLSPSPIYILAEALRKVFNVIMKNGRGAVRVHVWCVWVGGWRDGIRAEI
ncbi:hypothetical protein N9L68_07180 [bacterium]|nr:hypothetical protein [bacterium]